MKPFLIFGVIISSMLFLSTVDCQLQYQWLYNRPPMYRTPGMMIPILAGSYQTRPIGIRNCDRACACPYNFSPVCASNGKTYDNSCNFECERKCQPALRMLRSGACRTQDDHGFRVDY